MASATFLGPGVGLVDGAVDDTESKFRHDFLRRGFA